MKDYLDYLESPEWWSVRKAALVHAGYCCERCGGRGSLEVHHLSYAWLGAESLGDVVVLCVACHRAEHAPRNRAKRVLERAFGQLRLFDRWLDDVFDIKKAA